MDAFVCLDSYHDDIIAILSEKYVCMQYTPDDLKCCAKNDAHNIASMLCRKPVMIVYRHIDTINQIPPNLSGKSVLFTVKSSEISKDLEVAIGGAHRMFLCEDDDDIKYTHSIKKNISHISMCRTWTDIVSIVAETAPG